MKKIIYIIFTLIITLGIVSVTAAQVDIGLGSGGIAQQIGQRAGYNPGGVTDKSLSQAIGKIIKVALSLAGTVFLVLTIYAGILWMTASGNEEKVETATKILRASMIGLIIVVGAYGLTVFVLIAVTSAAGLPSKDLGAGVGGAGGFWSSFGTNFKNNWYNYVF